MKKLRLLFFTIPIVGVLCGTVLFLLLPFICDRFLLPRLVKNLPFSQKEISLSRISPWLVRGTLTFADGERPILAIPKFEVHFSPDDLLHGKISQLLIDSASLEIDMTSDTPQIHGLTLSSTSPEQNDNPAPFLLPIGVDTVIIKNLAVTLQQQDNKSLHFSLDSRLLAEYSDLQDGKIQPTAIHGQLRLKGDLNTTANASARLAEGSYEINFQVEPMEASQFRNLMPGIQQLDLGGTLTVAATARLDGQGQLTSYQASAQLSQFRFANGTLALAERDSQQPVSLILSGDRASTQYALKNIALTKPETIAIDLDGRLQNSNGDFSGEAMLYPKRTGNPVKIVLQGQATPSATRVEYHAETSSMRFGNDLQLSPITANGEVRLSDSVLTAFFEGRIGSINLASSKIELANVVLQLPFTFPADKNTNTTAGKFSVETISYRGIPSGSLLAEIIPATDSIGFSSQISTSRAPELQLSCEGSISLANDLSLGCRLPETSIDQSVLSSFIDTSEELAFTGRIAADLIFSAHKGIQAGKLTVSFHDGNFTYGPNSLGNINFDVTFPRVPLPQSRPGQLCTIGQATFGNIRLTDGRIRFRVEDEQTIFIEKSRFNWCGGKVETTSFSVSPEMKELEATLYCDRLNFTRLLGQFGINGAEGDGSLNGRLPLFISSEGVVFDDGFLFSTPGNSGIVRFKNTVQLRQGIPDIDQSAYLDYSMRALENFSYNWAKLTFNSELDQLLINMKLDGKPVKPLPFGYKNGAIVPTDKGPGLKHPIRLDVNFRLPLQEMFHYGKNIQSIMENM